VAERPPVEPDRTTSKYIVGVDDIENLPMVRSASEFIELQAGVSVDGDVSIRAGDAEDTAYYVDGVRLQSTDGATRVYRDVNRSSIQEMTVVTGGMEAEYGNAQAGVVSFVTREGGQQYRGLVDYQFQPAGQKHWGANVYESPMHRGKNDWENPDWIGETVTLPDGSSVPAHQRLDYTGSIGHYLEGNLSGPLSEGLTFFASSKWNKEASTFPGPNLTTPFNTNTNLKVSYTTSPTVKVRVGGFYDKRKGSNRGPTDGGALDVRNDGKNLFMVVAAPAGGYEDADNLIWAGVTHSLSPKTFYELRLSASKSTRDTTGLPTGGGLANPETSITGNPVKDVAGFYTVFRQVVNWQRFSRSRLALKGDLSSQVNKQNFVKVGFEATRFDNWWQRYYSDGPSNRTVRWYSKSYNDVDFFPGKSTLGVNPIQWGAYIQDKIEFEGMIVNAGIRADALQAKEWVTDAQAYYGGKSPMWKSMTRNRNVPEIEAGTIAGVSPRLGISHPITSKSLIRFFFGKFKQMPNFEQLYRNEWQSQNSSDSDLNGNGTIDTGERWNAFNANTGRHHAANANIPPEETVNFELGLDWNFVSDYVASMTSYYKSAGHQLRTLQIEWQDPAAAAYVAGQGGWSFGDIRDTRGFEISLKKAFSNMFAFNLAYNLQWADEGGFSVPRSDVNPDSLFVANGHYWLEHTVDPSTGAEIPVPLSAADRIAFGNNANTRLRNDDGGQDRLNSWAWIPWISHYAAAGYERWDGALVTKEYGPDDAAYWKRVTADPNYPGVGEGNLLVRHNARSTGENTPNDQLDRRAFGSLTFMFATPTEFGPWGGEALGNLRANMVYRVYTGTPFNFQGLLRGVNSYEYGPAHTRVDLNVEKQIGMSSGANVALAVEVFNLFNQKDTNQSPASGTKVDLDEIRWQKFGISGLEPTSADYLKYGEINDIGNYLDRPRELNFSFRLKW
ncbi:MAG: TonB-dependent receptor plug domain-containing protein, partial [Candidatus Latescibacterota bacterium]|nr:TonB-dependent receptor plug domain-containing protein [Candidatus Latescibacterota bacterium]